MLEHHPSYSVFFSGCDLDHDVNTTITLNIDLLLKLQPAPIITATAAGVAAAAAAASDAAPPVPGQAAYFKNVPPPKDKNPFQNEEVRSDRDKKVGFLIHIHIIFLFYVLSSSPFAYGHLSTCVCVCVCVCDFGVVIPRLPPQFFLTH